MLGVIGSSLAVALKSFYPREKHTAWFGLILVVIGNALCFLGGRTLLIPVGWELSTFGVFFIYLCSELKWARSFSSYVIASSFSVCLLVIWILCPTHPLASLAFIIALLLKTGFLGMHFWLPLAYAEAPAPVAALFSGLLANTPLLLFAAYGESVITLPALSLWILVHISALGVVMGGLIAFFKQELKWAIAYSSIEQMGFLWVCLIASLALTSVAGTNPSLQELGRDFRLLFYIALTHHSLAKSFQFLGLGYLGHIAQSDSLSHLKGIGRDSGISSLLLGIGTFSFMGLPSTLGCIVELLFFTLLNETLKKITPLPLDILPAIGAVLVGLIFGAMAHWRMYLTLVLSVPNPGDKKPDIVDNGPLKKALYFLGFAIMGGPLALFLIKFFREDLIPPFFLNWITQILYIHMAFLGAFAFFIFIRRPHRIQKRVLWDCGSGYLGNELSVPAQVFSEPLTGPLSESWIMGHDGARIDNTFYAGLHAFNRLTARAVKAFDPGKIGSYLSFSVVFLLLSILAMVLIRWSQMGR
jgi:NADH:ubiquinone oxidoreductase subunit 5 (subunit L)/multisubunit Na+/H+ antiporter MnhA subunit